MPQPNLRIFFDGIEEAKPDMPCYDPEQPWFAHVTVVNANADPKWPAEKRALDPQKPTAAAGPFKVFFQVFPGIKSASALADTPYTTYAVDGLGAYPGGLASCAQGFSMQLPKDVAVKDLGVKRGFLFKADFYQSVIESNEDDNLLVWESGVVPGMAPPWKEGDPSPFSNLKFMAFKAVPGSQRELDVLVKNQGSETSFQLELRLSIMGPPTPASPTGSVADSASANSTAIPPGASVWVRFKARTPFVQPLAALSARELQRLQAANPASRRFRQVQMGSSGVLGGQGIPRYLVVEKDFDFLPLKPFFITLMNATRSEKVAFGENPQGPVKRPDKGGPIAIPRKDR